MNAWGKETPKTVALACDSTHCNSVVANALAAAYQAPVLPVGRLAIPESVEAYLYNCEPETIFIFDCGLCMKEAMDQINTLPWHPEVVVFGVNEDPFDFSCEVFDYGQTRGLWNDEVLLVSFEDNPEAMAVSPYLYARLGRHFLGVLAMAGNPQVHLPLPQHTERYRHIVFVRNAL